MGSTRILTFRERVLRGVKTMRPPSTFASSGSPVRRPSLRRIGPGIGATADRARIGSLKSGVGQGGVSPRTASGWLPGAAPRHPRLCAFVQNEEDGGAVFGADAAKRHG